MVGVCCLQLLVLPAAKTVKEVNRSCVRKGGWMPPLGSEGLGCRRCLCSVGRICNLPVSTNVPRRLEQNRYIDCSSHVRFLTLREDPYLHPTRGVSSPGRRDKSNL